MLLRRTQRGRGGNEEGEGRAAKGRGPLQAGHLSCASLSGCPNSLRYFRFKDLWRPLFLKDLPYALYLSCFSAGDDDVYCINLCRVPMNAWSPSFKWCENWFGGPGSAQKPGEGLFLWPWELQSAESNGAGKLLLFQGDWSVERTCSVNSREAMLGVTYSHGERPY